MDMISFDSQEFVEIINRIKILQNSMDQTYCQITKACRMLSEGTDKFDTLTKKLRNDADHIYKSFEKILSKSTQIVNVYDEEENDNVKLVKNLRSSIYEESKKKSISIVQTGYSTLNNKVKIVGLNVHICVDLNHENWLLSIADNDNFDETYNVSNEFAKNRIVPHILVRFK